MPNFDALRTSTLGALSYLSFRPKKSPLVKGLWPLNGSTADISMYNAPSSLVNSFYASSPFPGVESWTIKESGVHYFLNPDINWSAPWTIDWMMMNNLNNTLPTTIFQMSAKVSVMINWTYGLQLYTASGRSDYGQYNDQWGHHAFRYDGTDIKYFFNGTLKKTLSSSDTSSFISETKTIFLGGDSGPETAIFSNIRFVQKALGDGTSFPVPTSLYTGYEPL